MQTMRIRMGRVLCATLLALGLSATQAMAADEEIVLAQQADTVSQETVIADSDYSDAASESSETTESAGDAVTSEDSASASVTSAAEQLPTSSDVAGAVSSDQEGTRSVKGAATSETDQVSEDGSEADETGEELANEDESVDETILSSSEDAESLDSSSDSETVDELEGNSYAITSAKDNSYSIGIVGSSTASSAKTELESDSKSLAQRWLFSDAGNGYVYITNVNSGLVLDVAGGRAESGTKIQQYVLNETAAQKWRPVKIAEGLFVLVSGKSTNAFSDDRADWLVLDLSGGKVAVGQSIQLWTYNGSLAQRWNLTIDTSDLTNSAANITSFASNHAGTLTDGSEIVLAPTSGGYMVIDVSGGSKNNGANVQAYESNSTDAQVWKVSTDAQGFITLINKKSGKALDVKGAKAVSGTNVQQYTSNGTNAQKWVAAADASGAVTLWSALGKGLVLDVKGAGKTNGTNIQIYKSNGSAAQLFTVVSSGIAASENQSIEDGYYTICLDGTSLVADVKGASLASGAVVQTYTSNNTLAQVFYVTYGDDGYYRIIDINSHMFLSVGKNLLPGAPVIQEAQNDSRYGQRWNIVKVDSNYRIVSALSSQSLASVNSKKATQLVANSSSSAQRWTFNTTTPNVSTGVYTIISALNHKTVLDICSASTSNGVRVQGYAPNGSYAQRFFLSQVKSGIYTIEALVSYKYITVDLSGNITQRASTGEENQNWAIEFTPYGYRFVNQNSNKAISLASTANSTKTSQSTGKGAGQSFALSSAAAFDFGCYVIELAKNTDYALDVKSGSKVSGANVQLYSSNDTKAQKWFINDAGSGYVTIVNALSGLQLAVSGGEATARANIDQETADSATSKKWKMVYAGEGTFNIVSALNTGMGLDVNGCKVANGTNIQLYTASSSNSAQLWSLEKTSSGILIAIDPGHGGTDSGAVGNGLRECDLTWSITQACAAKLKDYGYEVYITVSQSEFKNSSSNVISISDRVQRAYNKGAVAIFSMHINAGGGNGAVCLVPNSSSYHKELYTQGQKFASLLLPKINSIGITTWSDGAWERNYSTADGADTNEYYSGGGYKDYYGIVRYARLKGMLGIIIEHGFIDSSDASLLRQSSIQTKLGQADAWAINQLYKSLA